MNNRHEMVERLLRRSPPIETEPDEQGSCLDAETLAAWAEDGLQRAEQAQVEVHLARCARCQAMLAAFGRGAPADEVSREASWRRWGLGWLVPIAAGVAAVAIWIAVPDRKPNPQKIVVQRTDSGRPDAPPSMGPTGTQASEPDQMNRVAPLVPPEAAPRDERIQPAPADRQSAQSPGAAGRPSPTSTAAVGAAPAFRSPSSDAEVGRLRAMAASRARALADAAEVASTVVASPDPQIRWRFTGSTIQYSNSGGRLWEDVAVDASQQLTAGAAPSSSVCWIVGRAGTVLRTLDGRRFQHLRFPESVDLTSVQSTADATAIVMTSDGRLFRTDDGGSTWNPTR